MRLRSYEIRRFKCVSIFSFILSLTLLSVGFGCSKKSSLSFEVNDDPIGVAVEGNSIEVYRNGERISHFEFYSDRYTITSFQGEKEIIIKYSEGRENPAMSWYLTVTDKIGIIDYDHQGRIISQELIEK